MHFKCLNLNGFFAKFLQNIQQVTIIKTSYHFDKKTINLKKRNVSSFFQLAIGKNKLRILNPYLYREK